MSDPIKKVYQAFDPGPLSAEDTDLYVDLDEVRGSSGLVREFARSIRLARIFHGNFVFYDGAIA